MSFSSEEQLVDSVGTKGENLESMIGKVLLSDELDFPMCQV